MFKRIYISIIIISFAGMVSSCRNPFVDPPGEENQAPYPVTADFTSQSFKIGEVNNTFQLLIFEQGGLQDPDGDVVLFKSSVLPEWISLDSNTGVVTVDTSAIQSAVTISFWSEDALGADTSDAVLEVVISVYNNPPYPVTAGFVSQEFNQGAVANTFTMLIDEQSGLKDPEGDTVYFRSNAPAWMTLAANTGVVTVDTSDGHAAVTVSFWSEDENGEDTSGTVFDVLVSVNSKPNPLVSPSAATIARGTTVVQTFQLQCSTNIDNADLFDLEGDTITVIVDGATPLPGYMSLDSATGEITVVSATGGDLSINFWTVDDKGATTESDPLTVVFTLYDNQNPYNIISPVGPDTASAINLSYDTISYFNLLVDKVGGQDDPDEDVVVYKYTNNFSFPSSFDDNLIEFNENSGAFSITHLGDSDPNSGGFLEFYFWTEDPYGGSSAVHIVWFSLANS